MRCILLLIVLLLLTCNRPLPRPEPVVLERPVDGEVTREAQVGFEWQGTSAAAYELQVAAQPNFTDLVVDRVVSGDSAWTVLTRDDRYYWRVRQQSTDSVWSEWSVTFGFVLERFRVVATVRTQGYPHDVVLDGNRAYVADGQAGLAVFDVSNPESPVLAGAKMDSLNEAWGVAVRDSYAYIAYGYKELMIVKVNRPDSIVTVGVLEYPQPAFGYDVVLVDSFAYIAADAQFIRVNIADPRYPNLVYQGYYPRDCCGIVASGSHAFVALQQLGVASWRLDTAPPVQVGSMDTPGKARGVALDGGYLYIADGLNGLVVADVSDPTHIEEAGTLALRGYAMAVAVQDTLAFLACGTAGVAVVNVTEPAAPHLVAEIPAGYTMGVCASGRYVFAGDRDMGLMVIKQEE